VPAIAQPKNPQLRVLGPFVEVEAEKHWDLQETRPPSARCGVKLRYFVEVHLGPERGQMQVSPPIALHRAPEIVLTGDEDRRNVRADVEPRKG
jgi:hypothetical protein